MLFKQLGLRAELLRSIEACGYSSPTPIQAKAISVILKNHDVLAGAQTGTGKTAAFALPILQKLSLSKSNNRHPRALVLAPTRELAAQVGESIRLYGKYLNLSSAVVFGGVGIGPQINQFRKGVDILVATPGRLIDHVGRGTVDLSKVEILILDEADRMLDMGFIHDIRRIIKRLPVKRQNLMFSATYSNDIKKLSDTVLRNPIQIEVARRNATAVSVTQKIHKVAREQKRTVLSNLIQTSGWNQVLVFTRTKRGANKLTKQLLADGVSSAAIHGDKSQSVRTRALADFKQGKVKTLVATDIAARGLDIAQLPCVVNFDLPNVPEDYVHRIGRTGRAGANGIALSLVCPDEHKQLRDIQKLLKRNIPVEDGPNVLAKTRQAVRPVKKKQDNTKRKQDSKPLLKATRANRKGGKSQLPGEWFAQR